MDKRLVVTDYTHRLGYDPNFLGIVAPLPQLTPRLRRFVATDDQLGGVDKTELKYEHFSVVMNKARRLAFFAAVNVDVNAQFKTKREGGDEWVLDPRLPDDLQAGDRYYSNNPLDRGHLVRREDAAWGQTAAEAERANTDTFHFTNCAPQHEVFNQSGLATKRHLKLWGNLENYLTQFARSDKKRLCIFNGPVFRAHDRIHRGLRVPREFWKAVIFDKGDGQPTVVAFLLSQQDLIADLAKKDLEVGEFKMYQISISQLERLTKLNFNQLRSFDALERGIAKARLDKPAVEVTLVQALVNIVV